MLNLAPPKNQNLPIETDLLAQPLSEILGYFQNELGDKYVEFKSAAKS